MAITPTVRGVTEGAGASSTSHTITFTQTTGDRVVIFLNFDATARTLSTVGDSFVDLTNISARFHILTKVLDGTEGGNMVVTIGVASKSAWLAYNITTGTHASGTAPVFSTVATGTSTAPNSATLSPSGGSAKYLWLSAFSQAGEEADDDTWCSAAPSTPGTFTGLVQKATGTAGAVSVNGSVAAAQYASETATVDPGAFTVAQSLAWRAYTVAIYPSLDTNAPAECASGTGAAYGAAPSCQANAGLASGTGAASWGASYSATILADSPVAYWRLGEPSGTNANDEVGTADGTYVNTPTLGVTGALTDDADTAATFTAASTEYVTVGDQDALDLGNGPFSIEFWAKRTSTGAWATIIDKGSNAPKGYGVYFYTDSKLHAELSNTGDWVISTDVAADTTAWHHWVVTKNGDSDSHIYRDGSDVTSTTTSRTLGDNTNALFIGAFNNGGSPTGPVDAGLDEVALYKAVLTPTQVTAHYTAGTTGGGTGGTTAKVSPNAGLAAGTGTAYDPPFPVFTNAPAELAAGTGVAYDAPIRYAPAGLASGTGAAHAPPVSVALNGGVASGTGTAYQPAASLKPNAGVASGTGTAYATTMQYAPAGLASGTGAAGDAVLKLDANAGLASAAGAALDPTVDTGGAPTTYADAGLAAGTGTAYATAMQYAPAGLAAGTGAAADTGKTVAPNAGAGTGTGAAYQPTVSGGTNAPAGHASGTGAALDATVTASPSVFAWADTATGTGTAYGAAIPTISGVTRDEHGTAIPLCTVDAFVSATNAFYGTTTSNGTGHYSIVVAPGVAYFLVAYSALDVYGVTARDLMA